MANEKTPAALTREGGLASIERKIHDAERTIEIIDATWAAARSQARGELETLYRQRAKLRGA